MPDFDDLRRDLRDARTASERAVDDVASAREEGRRVDRRIAAFERSFDAGNTEHVAERARLLAAKSDADARLQASLADRESALAALAGAFVAFEPLTDPRSEIEQLSDQIPILMFPVRLETRFKAAEGDPSRPELWLRIFPDDCSIDSFEATLSEAEVANAQLYWTGIWEAGRIEDQERGAWRGLVASHGSGRAEWIVTNYEPTNLAEQPSKALPTDVILTIATETPLADAQEKSAASDFWRDLWLADGDAAKAATAEAALVAAVGAARAEVIASDYEPANFARDPESPLTRDAVNVGVAFVEFPKSEDLDTKEHSWSRPPRAVTLPDRFVFLGYSGEAEPLVALGSAVESPLVVGIDPSAPVEDQLQQDEHGDIVIPDEMQWMVDFDRAVAVGMGMRIPLDGPFVNGFDRVLVIGLRLSADETAGKEELETLIEHHRLSRPGLSLLPQGTPTNNTEQAAAGFARGDDPDASFDDLATGDLFTADNDWLTKKDGQWLAEFLGIDNDVLTRVRHSGGTDQCEARAMNTALWPATLGYWLQTMMDPLVGDATAEATREFFNRHVSGRGAIPSLRIGMQPYGILPATPFSRMHWTLQDDDDIPVTHVTARRTPFLAALNAMLQVAAADWRAHVAGIPFAGKAGDPHRQLLDIVGLHPTSVEFSQRYAQSAEELFNKLRLAGLGHLLSAITVAGLQLQGTNLLEDYGRSSKEPPDILRKFFFGSHNLLKGPLVDDRPLSESEAIRPYATGDRNYLEWLIDAAATSLDELRKQQGFIDNKRPQALLYIMLRHALQLGYHDTSLHLHLQAELISASEFLAAKREPEFLHISEAAQGSESRYVYLDKTAQTITNSTTMTIGDFIGSSLSLLPAAGYLRRQLRGIEHLKDAPTARLERVFAEHVDTCSYRLDAWMLGLVHYQLAAMRNVRDGVATQPRQGIHLGAYAWLEDLRPESRVRTPVTLDEDLAAVFDPAAEPVLERDSANQGFVHAPSLDHATAAAVLRNGYISTADRDHAKTMAVNLTSERVRIALGMLEGIRNGQSLGALLGYQFERGLHDRHGLAEVDKFIYDLRKKFPLRSGQNKRTQTGDDVPIEAVEARNVLDGLKLVRRLTTTTHTTYPFGFSGLPSASDPEAAAINAEADRLLDSHDAVADLALAEGVFQAVVGNYDRVASTYEAYSKGNFPPEPQIVETPATGIGLTHRVAIHLEPGVDPTVSPVAGIAMSPRARVEAALNRWLSGVLPDAGDVGCTVTFFDTATQAARTEDVTLHALGLQPADVLRLVTDESEQAMAELDDRIVNHAVVTFAPRPDTPVQINYLEPGAADVSVFELMPLTRSMRALVDGAVPLQDTDMMRSDEAGEVAGATFDDQRVTLVRADIGALKTALANVQTDLQTKLDDLENQRDQIVAGVENTIQTAVPLLMEAATFAIAEAGWGFVHDFRQRTFTLILRRCTDVVTRWDPRLAEFGLAIAAYDALPATASDDEKYDILVPAEPLVSTATTSPLPAPDAFRAALVAQRDLMKAKRDAFADMQATTQTSIPLLLDEVAAIADTLNGPFEGFDFVEFSLEEERDEVVQFVEDLVAVITAVLADIDARIGVADPKIAEHGTAADAATKLDAITKAAEALLGEDVIVIPEFSLEAEAGDEVANALGVSTSGTLFDYLDNTAQVDFPVDTWLYGVARVREQMRAWEQVVMFTGGFGRPEPELTPLQLPFAADDRWLALQIPPELEIDSDRLLYTAHFVAPFVPTAKQCGLLIDEWTETIPDEDATAGVAFHYDRPNNEAPQAMLLVTPPAFSGSWQWNDLVDALVETMELAKLRAVEPSHLDGTAYARFLPATVMATTVRSPSISANLAVNNNLMWADS